jgi:arsenical pump membrane protein
VGVLLLLLGVIGMVVPPRGLPRSAAPVAAAVAAVAVGATDLAGAAAAAAPLIAPLAFLAAAVPLAVLIDASGAAEAVARRVAAGPGLLGRAWLLAAVVTAVLNLDAAVVLLTPLYLRIARRTGTPPLVMAAIPALQASLASSPLPVSNLTNLIAVAEHPDVGTLDVLGALGPASAAAVAVGWMAFRRWSAGHAPPAAQDRRERVVADPGAAVPDDRPASVRWGLGVGAACAVGFVGGEAVGAPPWAVAVAGVAVLALVLRRLPVGALPLDPVAMVLGLGVLVAAVAPTVPVPTAAGGGVGRAVAELGAVSTGVAGALVANNLPALLAALPALRFDDGGSGYGVLLGLNAGPVLAVWASLASLLWLHTCRQLGVPLSAADYHRLGWRVGLPALAAAAAVRAVQAGIA